MSLRKLFTPPEDKETARVRPIKKTPTKRRTNFASIYPDTAKITMLINHNPKKPQTEAFTRFEGYKGAVTVRDALDNGVTYQDIAHDLGRRFILVTD